MHLYKAQNQDLFPDGAENPELGTDEDDSDSDEDDEAEEDEGEEQEEDKDL